MTPYSIRSQSVSVRRRPGGELAMVSLLKDSPSPGEPRFEPGVTVAWDGANCCSRAAQGRLIHLYSIVSMIVCANLTPRATAKAFFPLSPVSYGGSAAIFCPALWY